MIAGMRFSHIPDVNAEQYDVINTNTVINTNSIHSNKYY